MSLEDVVNRAVEAAKSKTGVYDFEARDLDLSVREEIGRAVLELVAQTMEIAILGAQSILSHEAEKYINGLRVEDDFSITIDSSIAYLERGYPQYDMLPGLLSGPKAKTSKSGHRYNTVPLGKKNRTNEERAVSKLGDILASVGSRVGVDGSSLRDMVKEVSNVTTGDRKGMPKIESETFRTASDTQVGSGKWQHPGFPGVKQLDFLNANLRVGIDAEATSIVINWLNGVLNEHF